MVGVQLRTEFMFLTKHQKHGIKELCGQYNVKPECSYSGGGRENMTFDFGDDVQSKKEFMSELEIIMGVSADTNRRQVCGHRIECPL